MSIPFASVVATALAIYVVVGIVAAVRAHLKGLDPGDSDITDGSWGFRTIITPGLVALWPLYVGRGLGAADPVTPHDRPVRPSGRTPRAVQFWAVLFMLIGSLLILSLGWASRPETPPSTQTGQR